jgi:hypothetical protein
LEKSTAGLWIKELRKQVREKDCDGETVEGNLRCINEQLLKTNMEKEMEEALYGQIKENNKTIQDKQ